MNKPALFKVKAEYPGLSEIALKTLLPFPSTYLCETGFSTMSVIKCIYTEHEWSIDVCLYNVQVNRPKYVYI